MAGMRDVLIHDYVGVDLKTVWKVAQERLPELNPPNAVHPTISKITLSALPSAGFGSMAKKARKTHTQIGHRDRTMPIVLMP